MPTPDISKKVNWTPAKHYPRPQYDRCNAGHPLVEVYDESRNAYIWDCLICKRKMRQEEPEFMPDLTDYEGFHKEDLKK